MTVLSEIQARCEAATQGIDFCADIMGDESAIVFGQMNKDTGVTTILAEYHGDEKIATFIAHSRTDVPRLCEAVKFLLTGPISAHDVEHIDRILRGDK